MDLFEGDFFFFCVCVCVCVFYSKNDMLLHVSCIFFGGGTYIFITSIVLCLWYRWYDVRGLLLMVSFSLELGDS